MGATFAFPKTNVTMKHFSSQIYNNVGVATFYLDGSHGDINALWRVTAVWVWTDGVWKEAHHHESELKYLQNTTIKIACLACRWGGLTRLKRISFSLVHF
jgi:hypothetical protein